MSCFNLQIRPNKSWKTLASGLRSKLRKLKTSTTHVVATTRRLTSRSRRSSALRSYREMESNSFMALYVDQLYAAAQQAELVRATEAAAARRPAEYRSAASIDSSNHGHGKRVMKCESSSSGLQSGNPKADKIMSAEESSSVKYETVDDAWKAIVAKSPLLRVDERAEEFITKFRKDMMLQKEKSLIDYQEMIARGA